SNLKLELFEQTAKNNEYEEEIMTFTELINHKSFKEEFYDIINGRIILYEIVIVKEENKIKKVKGKEIDFTKRRENQMDWERSDTDYVYYDSNKPIEKYFNTDKVKVYTETVLKQAEEETRSLVKNFVARMKMMNIEVPKPRLEYYVLYIHGIKEVYKRMILVDKFNPKEHRIDKYHYLKDIKSFLSVCMKCSEKKTEEWLVN
ncbi:4057_t:CDS:2, partial [Cetraspora pellucida]